MISISLATSDTTNNFPNRDARSCDNLNGYYAKVSLPKLKSSHNSGVVPQPPPSQFQDTAAAGFGAFAGGPGLYLNNPNPNYPFLRHHHQQQHHVHYMGTPPVNPR